MAFAHQIKCADCGQKVVVSTRSAWDRAPEVCNVCSTARVAATKAAALAAQAALPLEERLAAIEEFIYEHR